MEYIEPKSFNDFRENQNRLINILNHNVTRLQADVAWLKKFCGWQVSLLIGVFISLLGILFKLLVGF